LVKQRYGSPASTIPNLPHATIAAANAFAAEALTANPWIERVPFAFSAVTPRRRTPGWVIRDAAGHWLLLNVSEAKAWTLYSLSGGHPVSLAGEWDGEEFTPLSIWAEARFLRV
jgi:hypothetical protein